MIGANRIIRGQAITSPFGNPSVPEDAEVELRREIVARAIEMLETDVAPRTIW